MRSQLNKYSRTRLAADLLQAVAASLQVVELLLLVECHVGGEGLTCD